MATALSLGACRQADGPMPPTLSDTSNRVGDVSRDLLAAAAGDPAGSKDLSDDLKTFATSPEGEAAAVTLASRVADVVRGAKLTEQTAQQLAHSLWTVVAGRELSERQVEVIQGEVKTQLTAIGVLEPTTEPVIAEIVALQNVVTARPRRWYEVF